MIPAAFVQDLFDGLLYINIHTELYPPGEIRGNLIPAQVPEPSAPTLMIGLLIVAAAFRRRR